MKNGVLAYIGIGSNLGDSARQCKDAIAQLSRMSGISVERFSSLYKTEPFMDVPGASETEMESSGQNWFVNAVAELKTRLSAHDLFRTLQAMEDHMGRVRTYPGAPRVIDLDLLLYGQEMICEEDLIVPHPRMHQRRFVLEPMCEIASYTIHPAFGVSMRGLKDRLDDQKIVLRCEI